MGKITEKTLFPLSVVLMVIAAVYWVSEVKATSAENSHDIAELKAAQADYMKTLQSIDRRLANIEGAVGARR